MLIAPMHMSVIVYATGVQHDLSRLRDQLGPQPAVDESSLAMGGPSIKWGVAGAGLTGSSS